MSNTNRLHHIDTVKAIAAQCIVWHHFSAYGPLSDALFQAYPIVASWLYEYARMTVQVFLVMGGYFAARSLTPEGIWLYRKNRSLWDIVLGRWLRLVLPFAVALIGTVLCGMWADRWLDGRDDDFISPVPNVGQVVAHLSLSFDILDIDALSAGAWYVAMDFQLYGFFAILMWIAGRWGWALVSGMMLASLFIFNRYADWDIWTVYFFGSYGMGALVWWAQKASTPQQRRVCWVLLVGSGVAALAWDFRPRVALAWIFSLWLLAVDTQRMPALPFTFPDRLRQAIQRLGQSSYALFLTHFAVLMLANALWKYRQWHVDGALPLMLAGAWCTCMGLAFAFERWVERKLSTVSIASIFPATK